MNKELKPKYYLTYNPCQPGYQQAGKHYIQLDYSGDCRLGKYISEIFEVESPAANAVHIIPDGCNDIIITYNGKNVTGWLSPSIRRATEFHFGIVKWILGIRFLPGATYALFHNRTDYDRENITDISLLFPGFERYKGQLCEAHSFVKRHEILTNFIVDMANTDNRTEEVLYFCIYHLVNSKGLISIEELSQKAGYSDRYIRRLFTDYVGHTPKELGNIIRMQSAIGYIWNEPAIASLGEIASLFGFSDQSHMNREFRKFLGITSGAIKEYDNWIAYLKTLFVRNF